MYNKLKSTILSLNKSIFNSSKSFNLFEDIKNLKNNFFKDLNGQIAIEYLFISLVSILLILTIILPLVSETIDYSSDISKCSKNKKVLSDISNSIDYVALNGPGSRRILIFYDCDNSIINLGNYYDKNINLGSLSSEVKLSNNYFKKINVTCNYPLDSNSLVLKKGKNKILIEYPISSGNITIENIN